MRLEVIETKVGGKNVRKDGSVGQWLASEKVEVAVEAGQKKFPCLSIPALAIFYEGGVDAKAFEGGNPRGLAG